MGRRKPMSSKQKKDILKDKRATRRGKAQNEVNPQSQGGGIRSEVLVQAGGQENQYDMYTRRTVNINSQPKREGGRKEKYHLQFSKAKLDAEFERSKQAMHNPIHALQPDTLEYASQEFFPEGLMFPERPEGYRTMGKDELQQHENRSVRLFGEHIETKFRDADINLYEQNVETWKQLWRVMDKSDVLLFIVDIRFAVVQFPPYVYQRLASQGRGVVLVLNKIDLVPASLVLAWQKYFGDLCPGMQVIGFCSHEHIAERHRKLKMAVHSCRALVEAVEKVGKVKLDSWRRQIEREAQDITGLACLESDDSDVEEEEEEVEEEPPQEVEETEGDGRPFTVGAIGYPNVGKSSLINAILGKYKVGVSRNPGFTKYFQTHFLTREKDLLLCDCPGLIFPALCPYNLQVLSGTFPVSQVRGPMAVINFLASHINVPAALSLRYPQEFLDDMDYEGKWTPYVVSLAWASKRHYHVKGKGGRLDGNRAANELLRLSLTAKNRLVLALRPRGYSKEQGDLESHPEIPKIKLLQGIHAKEAQDLHKTIGHYFKPTENLEEDNSEDLSDDEDVSDGDFSDDEEYSDDNELQGMKDNFEVEL